jgi:hypothetical protein
MPDPRSEPLLGAPVVGDVAYMILADKGVQDVLPELAHKKPNELRMDDYFLWPSIGSHRLRLQTAVRGWLLKHSNCCAAPPIIWTANLSAPKLRMLGNCADKSPHTILPATSRNEPRTSSKNCGQT